MGPPTHITTLENVFEILESIPLDSFSSYRLKKELADAHMFFMAMEVGSVSDVVMQEIVRVPVHLSLLVIEQHQNGASIKSDSQIRSYEISARNELLYNFVAQHFKTPCEIRIGRVENTLRQGIHYFPTNFIIPMELGKAYIARTLECVHEGNTYAIPTYLAKVQEYFQIAAARSQKIEKQKTGQEILELAYSLLPGLRGKQR